MTFYIINDLLPYSGATKCMFFMFALQVLTWWWIASGATVIMKEKISLLLQIVLQVCEHKSDIFIWKYLTSNALENFLYEAAGILWISLIQKYNKKRRLPAIQSPSIWIPATSAIISKLINL